MYLAVSIETIIRKFWGEFSKSINTPSHFKYIEFEPMLASPESGSRWIRNPADVLYWVLIT